LAKNKKFKGLGPVKAKKVVAALGDEFEEILLNDSEKFAQMGGISHRQALLICHEWKQNKNRNECLTQLMGLGLTLHQSQVLRDKFGDKSFSIVQKNPYMLIKHVEGMGFLTVDAMAIKAGHDLNSEERFRAGITYQMTKEQDDGHCYLNKRTLTAKASALLNVEDIDIQRGIFKLIGDMVEDGLLASTKHDDSELISFDDTLHQEKYVFKCFRAARKTLIRPISVTPKVIEQIAPTLNIQQIEALNNVACGSSIITGGAGTGKSYTLDAIVSYSKMVGHEVLLAAPTGKAARRMSESIGDKIEAKTIHRLLEYSPIEGGFQRDESNKLEADLIVIDEFSMVDVSLCYALVSAIDFNKTRLVIMGDHNQLPCIGCGNILKDAIDNNLLPTVELTQTMRQSGVLKKNCTEVLGGTVAKTEIDDLTKWIVFRLSRQTPNEGGSPDVLGKLMSLFKNKRFEKNGFDYFKDVQVLSPQKKGPLGTVELNKLLQQYHQAHLGLYIDLIPEGKPAKLMVGDKVIQNRNNYNLEVMNGTLGIVMGETVNGDGDDCFNIEFETGVTCEIAKKSKEFRDIGLAYALTVHKVQGSEFPCTVVICHKLHTYMHHRNLLYTAVTRARKSCIIIGDRWGIMNCAKHQKTEKRRTFLPVFAAKSLEVS
jgi:exodeoxyribonuclease V alpha subunit